MNPHTFPFVVESDGKTVLSVTMRRPTIDDQMSFRASLENGLSDAITKILTTCTVEANDPGPWMSRPGADSKDPSCPVDWDRVTSGLRMQALFMLKLNSKADGHRIEVDMVCPFCPKDDNRFTAVVDARPIPDGELLWYEPEDVSGVVEAIVTGKPIESEVGGVKVGVKPPSGSFERVAEGFSKDTKGQKLEVEQLKANMLLRSRAYQIASVEGQHANDLFRWVKELPGEDYDELEAAIEAADWGVDLSFEAKCTRGHTMDGEIPFVYLFGRPDTAMKALRKRQRERAMSRKKRPASKE